MKFVIGRNELPLLTALEKNCKKQKQKQNCRSHNASIHEVKQIVSLLPTCKCLVNTNAAPQLVYLKVSPKNHRHVCNDTARLISLSTLINYAAKIRHTGKRIIHAVTQSLMVLGKSQRIQSILNVLTNSFLLCTDSTEGWQSNYISFTDKLRDFCLASLNSNCLHNILQSYFHPRWQTDFAAYNFLHSNTQMHITVLFS